MKRQNVKGDESEPEHIAIKRKLINLREFKSLPVFIVDYHHHILEFIYRCVGSRHLPVEGITLIHFDSHPDMVISNDILAKDTYDKHAMLEETSIESWIMPLCFTGIITRIVWIKNSWCSQIPNGKHKFQIGECNGKLYVDLALPYFFAEGSYCNATELLNARCIELYVVDANSLDTVENTSSKEQRETEEFEFLKSHEIGSKQQMLYILDIDLDFFSVNNPFLKLYEKSHCYDQLSKIFAFEMCNMEEVNATTINQRRVEKLETLKSIFKHLEAHGTLTNYPKSDNNLPELDGMSYDLMVKLVDTLNTDYADSDDEIDWMLVYDAGCTSDSGGLPNHKSTPHELETQYKIFKQYLKRLLPQLPIAVTIARSAEDNYCPEDQVDDIEENVLHCLNEDLAGTRKLKIINAYLNEDYNIKEL